MVGPGKGIDTDRYFIICANILGSCMGSTGPSSINPATGRPYGLDFPMVTIGDMVETQKKLLDHLGIDRLLAVIGGSVGGMQVLEWCVRYPQMVACHPDRHHHAPLRPGHRLQRDRPPGHHGRPELEAGRLLRGRRPDLGLALARMIGHVTYLSDEAMHRKFGRRLQDKSDFSFGFDADFQVESYLRHQGSKFVRRFDANSLLYITRAADYFDLIEADPAGRSSSRKNPKQNKISCYFLQFRLALPDLSGQGTGTPAETSGQDVSFCEIEADCGHDAFLIPDERLAKLIGGFLNGIARA